ncbi:MAG: tripartite tricarboxylate transporter substrate binding protein [Hyphomicrobiales bacterium]|nr:tripartite tricarboxylate transporter substrate binding protein [Hyphomicrobiales bacterium]
MISRLLAIAMMSVGLLVGPASAQGWPSKPIRLVVPWPAGGSADLIGRIVADHLTGVLKQTVVVDNRGGAAGQIGSVAVARSDPDGYTLLLSGIPSHVIAPATAAKPEYDGAKDFTHIAYLGGPPIVMAAHISLKAASLKDLIALGKTAKEPIGYVSAGVGSLGHIHAEYWARREGVRIQHVPYRGGAQAAQDFIAGHVPLGSMTWSSARAGIESGKLIPLAVSSSRRQPDFPKIPTFKDLGYDDLTTATWWSISGPPGMPEEIVQRLNREIRAILKLPKVQARLAPEAIETLDMSPAEFTRFVQAEIKKWGPVAAAVAKEKK